MIAEFLHWLTDAVWQIVDLLLLACRLMALWTCTVALYVLLDAFVRAGLLRGWFSDAQTVLRIIEGDPGRLAAIKADQIGAPCIASHQGEASSVLILGDGPGARLLLTRSVEAWRGGVIAIGAQGLADRLAVKDAVRFCPGEHGAVRLNPMLMLQSEPFAWREARILAAGLIGGDDYAAEILAAFMLDQLLTAPVSERHLAALRRRLFEPEGRNLAGRVHLKLGDAVQAHPEIARLARKLTQHGDDTTQALPQIAEALRPWADGRIEMATRELDLHLSDVACGGVSALLIEGPPGDAAQCQSLFATLAGMAIMQLTDAAKTDNRSRTKMRPVLLFIEDAAWIPCIPLLRRRIRQLGICRVKIIVSAANLAAAAFALGASSADAEAMLEDFDAVAAIGPQDDDAAQALAEYAGMVRLPHLVPIFVGKGLWEYAVWLFPFPCWPKTPRLRPDTLQKLKPLQTLLLRRNYKPKLRILEFAPPGARTTWRSEPLPPVAHAWSAPPISQPKTTIQCIREPVAMVRAGQTELPLAQSPEILPPGPFTPPPAPRHKRRKNS